MKSRPLVPPKHRRCEGGFTLLELIVATTIFAMVVFASYALFEASRGVASRAEARAVLFQTARAALRAIERDLRGALPAVDSAEEAALLGEDAETEELPMDRIEVTSVNIAVAVDGKEGLRGDASRVTYWVEEGRGLLRERRAALTPVTVFIEREENVEEIAPDVAGLDLRYYGEEWEIEWDSRVTRKLPRAVEVTIVVRAKWREEFMEESFTSRFHLPVGVDAPEQEE